MIHHFTLSLILVLASSSIVFADWRLYRKNNNIVASVNYLSNRSFRGQPSVWVRWHYATPRNGVGGEKIQFTADCAKHRLFEIAGYPYDIEGNYLRPRKRYSSPKEYPIAPGSLNEATYELLCH